VDDKLSPTAQTYAGLLECLGRMAISKSNLHSIRVAIKVLEDAVSFDVSSQDCALVYN